MCAVNYGGLRHTMHTCGVERVHWAAIGEPIAVAAVATVTVAAVTVVVAVAVTVVVAVAVALKPRKALSKLGRAWTVWCTVERFFR